VIIEDDRGCGLSQGLAVIVELAASIILDQYQAATAIDGFTTKPRRKLIQRN